MIRNILKIASMGLALGMCVSGCAATGAQESGPNVWYMTRPPAAYMGVRGDIEYNENYVADASEYCDTWVACAYVIGDTCFVYYELGINIEAARIHEFGHCNGWSRNHSWN